MSDKEVLKKLNELENRVLPMIVSMDDKRAIKVKIEIMRELLTDVSV